MKPILLIDFGSTYTKVAAADVENPQLLGTANAYTTVETDIDEGLSNALRELEKQTGKLEFAERYACSSAAGGLRLIASGLVPELTAKAAKHAALGAGAKVIKNYSYYLTREDVDEIDLLRPDIFLLTGGTDGGNSKCILSNAQAISKCQTDFPIIIAGNRSAADECAEILSGREIYCCENVLPTLGQLNIEPTGARIREVFLSRITHAKGLSKVAKLISSIVMPTPSAMLAAMTLLADGAGDEPGIGELMGIDLGGATTDVYSIAMGMPQNPNTVIKGLSEPRIKRTVEGDIGMRYSIRGVLDACGIESIAELANLDTQTVQTLAGRLIEVPGSLPDTPALQSLDFAVASMAIKTAVARHSGTLEKVFTPLGEAFLQTGKDLRTVQKIVLTGGALIHATRTVEMASHIFYDAAEPFSLRPEKPATLVDNNYILSAMGLLGAAYPKEALMLMKTNLKGAA